MLRIELVNFAKANMNPEQHRDYFLRNVVIPFKLHVGDDFAFVDDNIRTHRTVIVTEELRNYNNRRIDWPARSTDMNMNVE